MGACGPFAGRTRCVLRFKGGTCIKKIYDPDYRFSEDLDFTCLRQVEPEAIRRTIDEAAAWVRQQAGLEIGVARERDLHPRGTGGFRVRLAYEGPLRYPQGIKVHVDFTWQEAFLDVPGALLEIHHPYSDVGRIRGSRVWCYTLQELAAEKMRALIERGHPRDLYDVWQLLTRLGAAAEGPRLLRLFAAKCRHNGIDPRDLWVRVQQLREYEEVWRRALHNLVPVLPDVPAVIIDLERALRDLVRRVAGTDDHEAALRAVAAASDYQP